MYLLYIILLHIVCLSEADRVMLKNIEFVDVIKQNLRRNNDDYNEVKDKDRLTTVTTNNITGITTEDAAFPKDIKAKEKTNNNITSKIKSNRRAINDQSWEFDYNELKHASNATHKTDNTDNKLATATKEPLKLKKYKSSIKPKLPHIKRNISRLVMHQEKIQNVRMPKKTNHSKVVLPKIDLLMTTTSTVQPKQTTGLRVGLKKRVKKFKKFVSKNKQLFKLSSRGTQTQKLPSPLVTGKIPERALQLLKKLAATNVSDNIERAGDGREAEAVLPRGDQLDMAPAKGGRIERLRVKGRLCHRHVLLPEGPKYDSGGRWYVPAHPHPRAVHAYASSPPPRLLLPRCCNCCKKSVLGCE